MHKDFAETEVYERIEHKVIILNGKGFFPKRLIIIEGEKRLEYRIVKTKQGKFQLNK